uniref:Uncharacterized protein n=1 Tax=Oryza rufipogon TaxID=4529 RepID=A0A0E0R7H8_ORYRU
MEESRSGQPAMDPTRSDPSRCSCGSCSCSCGLLHMMPWNQYAAAYGTAASWLQRLCWRVCFSLARSRINEVMERRR